ncbi:pre-mRNA-splicing factor ISY1 homolog [Dysidea avara]|uniref:pre-mRNA-splicing factor ISY1 homolog n=1 Tax=Dysidea avara TaxID=196820 RepID=UPI00331D56A7
MARNQEKRQLLLNRIWSAKQDEGKVKERRPFLATDCNDLKEAEKWRQQVIRQISKKVSQIQNPGLGEYRIRDLNDEINKLLREKGHWQDRIVELGGPDYHKVGPKMLDHEGKEVPGNRGYKYFGAAKDLPGVRELFEKEPTKASRKTRGELARNVDADYYGYRDDDDGVLVPLEQEQERKAVSLAVKMWQESDKMEDGGMADEEDIYAVHDDDSDTEDVAMVTGDDQQKSLMAHISVPSQDDIEQMIIAKKKQELLNQYASDTLVQQEVEARTLLGL